METGAATTGVTIEIEFTRGNNKSYLELTVSYIELCYETVECGTGAAASGGRVARLRHWPRTADQDHPPPRPHIAGIQRIELDRAHSSTM